MAICRMEPLYDNMKKIGLFLGAMLPLLAFGQLVNDRPENATSLCTGESISGTNIGSTGDLTPCIESNTTVYYTFQTLSTPGNVYVTINIKDCISDFGYDQNMRLAVLDPENGNQLVSECKVDSASEFFLTAYSLEQNKDYLLYVAGDKDGEGVTEAAQCNFDLKLTGEAVSMELGPSKTITLGETTQIYANGAENYLWNPAEYCSDETVQDPLVFPRFTTTFQVTTELENGCLIDGWILVEVREPITNYNTITPNGDGINDVWNHPALSEFFPLAEVKIFSRWGKEVFSSLGYNTPWDGTYKGKDVPVGTYYYIVDLKNPNGKPIVYSGEISVIR